MDSTVLPTAAYLAKALSIQNLIQPIQPIQLAVIANVSFVVNVIVK